MSHFIYRITNLLNGKIYIGAHSGELDDNYMGSGALLNCAVRKYGKENFRREVLVECATAAEKYDKEREFVDAEFVARRDTYNLKVGGIGAAPGKDNTFYGCRHTDEAREKLRTARKQQVDPRLGTHCSDEHKAKLSTIMSVVKSGAGNNMFGKHPSELTKTKISQSLMETKRKMREAKTRETV